VEALGPDIEAFHLLVRHDDPFGIGFGVEFASNRQAGLGRRRADQFDNNAIAEQRFGAPVLNDERE
jgi:hypothetical protein